MHDISSDLSNARFRCESYCENLGDNRPGSLLLERNLCLIWKAQESGAWSVLSILSVKPSLDIDLLVFADVS
jgi:hypothetical protein